MAKIINYKAVVAWVEDFCTVFTDATEKDPSYKIPGTTPWHDFLRARMPGRIVDYATEMTDVRDAFSTTPLGEPDFPDLVAVCHREGKGKFSMSKNFAIERECDLIAAMSRQIKDWYDSLSEREQAKLPRMTWDVAWTKQQEWHQSQARKAEKRSRKLDCLDGEDAEHAIELGDGWRWVRLVTKEALDAESSYMGHCVGRGGYDHYIPGHHVVRNQEQTRRLGFPIVTEHTTGGKDMYPQGIWSLRKGDKGHVTVELCHTQQRAGYHLMGMQGNILGDEGPGEKPPAPAPRPLVFNQVQGRFNRPPEDSLRIHVARLAEAYGVPVQNGKWSIRDTEGVHHDLANLSGHIKVEGNLMVHMRHIAEGWVSPDSMLAGQTQAGPVVPRCRIMLKRKAGEKRPATGKGSPPVVTVYGLTHRGEIDKDAFFAGEYRIQPDSPFGPYAYGDADGAMRLRDYDQGIRGHRADMVILDDVAPNPNVTAVEIMARARAVEARNVDAMDAMAWAMQNATGAAAVQAARIVQDMVARDMDNREGQDDA